MSPTNQTDVVRDTEDICTVRRLCSDAALAAYTARCAGTGHSCKVERFRQVGEGIDAEVRNVISRRASPMDKGAVCGKGDGVHDCRAEHVRLTYSEECTLVVLSIAVAAGCDRAKIR